MFKKDFILKQLAIEKNKTLANRNKVVGFPNMVFITIKSNKDCKLDIVAQLSLQPEPLDEQQHRMRELKKLRNHIDYEALEVLDKDLRDFQTRN